MKNLPGKFLAGCRVISGKMASEKSDRMNGLFRVPFITETGLVAGSLEIFKTLMERSENKVPSPPVVYFANCLSTDGEIWEHVSVSIDQQRRDPTWMEMSQVKSLFFEDTEAVTQFHPSKAAHVNFHPHVLHLWRNKREPVTLPPGHLIGPVETDPDRLLRNEVLASLDEQRIRDYFGSRGHRVPEDPQVFWIAIHKAIVNIAELPHDVRARSDAWLAEHGYARSVVIPGSDGAKIVTALPFAKAKV